MVRNIIFDVGYVLMDYTWKDKFREWYDEEGVARLARTLFGEGIPDSERGLWIRYDNGLISDEEIRETCLRHLPDDRMAIWLDTEDYAKNVESVIELISSESILDNDLSKAAEIYVSDQDCAELDQCKKVFPAE